MFKIISKKLNYKIMFWLFILLTAGNMTIIYVVTLNVTANSVKSTKQNLDMLSDSMFQSLRNAMNTGDPVQINKAEDNARAIKGVSNLTIAKSQPLIDMYSPGTSLSKDSLIIQSFKDKKINIIESDNDNGHNLRMIKPMIATTDCL
ncbi:MAG: methyl-accepting chemotaxis protein, partial [Campylobacterota bacterium]|nr:methyl-accepting chemotaxis protein [Campylobacterota bacterium]